MKESPTKLVRTLLAFFTKKRSIIDRDVSVKCVGSDIV